MHDARGRSGRALRRPARARPPRRWDTGSAGLPLQLLPYGELHERTVEVKGMLTALIQKLNAD
ncbi:MAG: hypothetical protein IT165_03230 [Bryobacterales bacterium]|nr:hypothetical protein [Bryobacterales bacterium]